MASGLHHKPLPSLLIQTSVPSPSEPGMGSSSNVDSLLGSPAGSIAASNDVPVGTEPSSSQVPEVASPGARVHAESKSVSSLSSPLLESDTLTEPSRFNKQLGQSPLRFCMDMSGSPVLEAEVDCRKLKHSPSSNFIQDPLSTISEDIPVVSFASPTASSLPDTESSFSISTVSSSLSSRHVPLAPTFTFPNQTQDTADAHRLISAVLDFRAFQSLLSTDAGRESFRKWLTAEPDLNRLGIAKLDRWIDETRADALVKTVRDYSMALYSLYHNERPGSETNVVVPKHVNESALSTLSELATLDSGLGKTSVYLLKSLYGNEFQGFIHAKLIEQTRISLGRDASSTDSFCLSNPRLEDNPVVMVSLGFVELTGYEPADIIGHNCRILQRNNPRPLPHLREAIATGKSACELMLNYKKDGTPYYCLINVVPLFDSKGKLMFYIGGQVKVTGSICGSTEVFEPPIATFPTLAVRRDIELALAPGALPAESPRMRAHEDQLCHYRRPNTPDHPSRLGRLDSATGSSSVTLNRLATDALSEGGSTEPSSRSFVSQLKVALRKETSTLSLALSPPPVSLAPSSSTGADLASDGGSASTALSSAPGPFKERISTFNSASAQVLIFERHSYKVVYISRDFLPFLGLPTQTEEDVLSPAVLHHNFFEIIHGENGRKTKEVRNLVHNAVTSGLPASCHCLLKWDLGVKMQPNSPRQTYTRMHQKHSYQSSYSCSLDLIPLWTTNKCVVYTARVM